MSHRSGSRSLGPPHTALACGFAFALMLLSGATPVLAQGADPSGVLILAGLGPTELSVGLGGLIEQEPSGGSPAVTLGLSRPPSLGFGAKRDQWVEPAFEIGLAGNSDEAPCQDAGPLAPPDTCYDFYIVVGPRFRPLRESDRLWRPFVQLLVGSYWRGTGLKDPEFLDSTRALEVGGGIDLRRPTSIHGLRLSADYRRVFAGEGGRHQLQLVASYFVGWRGKP